MLSKNSIHDNNTHDLYIIWTTDKYRIAKSGFVILYIHHEKIFFISI